MPIKPFLKGQAFDPELVEAMDGIREYLRIAWAGRAPTRLTALVAKKIIELARRGLRNPTAIHMRAVNELKSNPQ